MYHERNFKDISHQTTLVFFFIWPLLFIFWPRWPHQTLRSENLYERGQNQEKEEQGPTGNVKRNLLKKKKIYFIKIWGCYAMEAEIRGRAIALKR